MKSRLKYLTVILVLAVYAGQSFAVVDKPCARMQSDSTYAMQSDIHDGMQHAGHQHTPDADDPDLIGVRVARSVLIDGEEIREHRGERRTVVARGGEPRRLAFRHRLGLTTYRFRIDVSVP